MNQRNISRLCIALIVFSALLLVTGTSYAVPPPTPISPVANPCPRFTAGGVIQNPLLYSARTAC
jgi:hypothetical protein